MSMISPWQVVWIDEKRPSMGETSDACNSEAEALEFIASKASQTSWQVIRVVRPDGSIRPYP